MHHAENCSPQSRECRVKQSSRCNCSHTLRPRDVRAAWQVVYVFQSSEWARRCTPHLQYPRNEKTPHQFSIDAGRLSQPVNRQGSVLLPGDRNDLTRIARRRLCRLLIRSHALRRTRDAHAQYRNAGAVGTAGRGHLGQCVPDLSPFLNPNSKDWLLLFVALPGAAVCHPGRATGDGCRWDRARLVGV